MLKLKLIIFLISIRNFDHGQLATEINYHRGLIPIKLNFA